MRIEIKNGFGSKQKIQLKPEVILRYLITNDDEAETLIMCRGSELELYTTDKDIYEALCSVKPYDNFNLNKLKKLFEVVDVVSYKKEFGKNKPIVKESRVEELRKLALKKEEKQNARTKD